MSLTPDQLAVLNNDYNAIVATAQAATLAGTALDNDATAQTALTAQTAADTATKTQADAALAAAGAQLIADANADFPTPSSSGG